MIITCPSCGARYNLSKQQIGPKGRKVRCVKCKHEWHQEPFEQSAADAGMDSPPIPPKNPATQKPVASDLATAREQFKQRMKQVAMMSSGAIFISLALLLLMHKPITNALPWTAPFYSLFGLGDSEDGTTPAEGLVVSDVERTYDEEDNLTVMVFTGTVTNTNSFETKVPEVRVTLLDDKGVKLDFWPAQLNKSTLTPGESTRWICRFFNPPIDKITEFKVTFVTDEN